MGNNITISPPVHNITIKPVSGFVFMPEALAYGFKPSPINTALISPIVANNVPISSVTSPVVLGGISLQPDVTVNVGSSTDSIVAQLLSSFRYTFDDFPVEEIEATVGALVYFSDTPVYTSTTFDVYSSSLRSANTDALTKGAKGNVFIYIGHSADTSTLTLLHKGYFDLEDSQVANWSPGKTIYLNALGQLDTTPSVTSGHWVKSLGFCIPNKENKKRVWFEPDSTYLKII